MLGIFTVEQYQPVKGPLPIFFDSALALDWLLGLASLDSAFDLADAWRASSFVFALKSILDWLQPPPPSSLSLSPFCPILAPSANPSSGFQWLQSLQLPSGPCTEADVLGLCFVLIFQAVTRDKQSEQCAKRGGESEKGKWSSRWSSCWDVIFYLNWYGRERLHLWMI